MGDIVELGAKFKQKVLTPTELHRAVAWSGGVCDKCGGIPVVRVRVFGEAKEVCQRSPEFVMKLAAQNEGTIPVVDFKDGKYIRVSQAYACASCKQELIREAAKAPSWCCVEVDTGPDPTNKIQASSAAMPAVGGG